MRIEGMLAVGLLAMFGTTSPAEAAEPDPIAPASQTSVVPRRAVVADPWFTRASVSATGGYTSLNASIPVAALETEYRGESQSAGLAIDLYGRRMGFHLALAGSATENVNAPADDAGGSRLTHGEGSLGIGATLVNSRGVYLSAGPAIEGRATAIAQLDQGNEAVASWQTVICGGDVRARVFAGPRVYFTGAAFVGAVPVSGGWQSVNAAAATGESGGEPLGSAQLEESFVVAGTLAASVRPAEWVALSGGVGLRDARYTFDDASAGSERSVRPYVALELLY